MFFVMFAGISIFVSLNSEGLQEINQFGIWIFTMVLLFLISRFLVVTEFGYGLKKEKCNYSYLMNSVRVGE